MSGRTIFDFSLATILVAVLASISTAQSNPGIGSAAPVQASTPALGCTTGAKTGKLEGKWSRELPGCSVVATLAGDELKFCISEAANTTRLCVTLTADYTLTKDGLVYGVFTGVDVNVTSLVTPLHSLMDCPFSFRTRTTSEGLMVSNTKFPTAELDAKETDTKELLALLGGMYKRCNDGSLPLTKTRHADTGSDALVYGLGAAASGAASNFFQGQLVPCDKNFVEQYYKAEFDTAAHQAPPASPPPSTQTSAKLPDLDRPARMITLKECIAIALQQGSAGFQTPTNLGSRLEILPKIQPGTGILNQRTELDIAINYLLANVEVAYWNLFAAYHNLYAQEEGLRLAIQSYRFTDTRATVGSEPSCNRDQARAQFERFRRMVIDARGQVMESERQLRGMLGLRSDDGKRLVPSDEPSVTLTKPDFQEAANEAMANRPEILQCRQDLKLQQSNLVLQKNLRDPDLRFISRYSITGLGMRDAIQSVDEGQSNPGNALAQLADNQYQNWTISGRLVMPLGARDANAQVREAQLNVARSYYQLRDTELKVLEYLTQQYRQVIQTHADIGPARAEREALQKYFAKINALISEGKYPSQDFLNYLTLQHQLAAAIATEYQVIANYRNALASFEFAKGTIQKRHEIGIVETKDATRIFQEMGQEKVAPNTPLPASMPSVAPAQPTSSYSTPERILVPAPREVSTPRITPAGMPGAAISGTPLVVPKELR